MVPKPFRERASPAVPRRDWNPATPYVVLALLVGSQAIQILWLKQERALDTRRAESRIQELREVVQRVQRGECVDVESLLGVSEEALEKEWSGGELDDHCNDGREADIWIAIREMEQEELLFQTSEEKKRKKKKAEAAREQEEQPNDRSAEELHGQEEARAKVESLGGAKFY